MKTNKKHNIYFLFTLCTLMITASWAAHAAAVVSRANSNRPSSASRVPTMTTSIQTQNIATSNSSTQTTTVETTTTTTEPVEYIEEEEEEEFIIEDKTSQFGDILHETTDSEDTTTDILADLIKAQRASYEANEASNEAERNAAQAMESGQNLCDSGLRKCMQEKCGKDFTKCSGDTDTIFGTKLDACRRDLPCSGHEFTIFTEEIKSDRKANSKIALYNSIVKCGIDYNDCIFKECGTTFSQCLGKRAGDAAIAKCDKIARECRKNDSGLSARALKVFGTVRQGAEIAIQRDEKRLYELRDQMASTCKRLGAMFDERSLACVYTINFYADEKNTLYASKKAYAGSRFNCDQNWFGVDITTFKENAFRATRAQTSATSALMGSGLGTATGAVTSGAVGRAIERTKAENALKKAEKEYDKYYGEDDDNDKESEITPPVTPGGTNTAGNGTPVTPGDTNTDDESKTTPGNKTSVTPGDTNTDDESKITPTPPVTPGDNSNAENANGNTTLVTSGSTNTAENANGNTTLVTANNAASRTRQTSAQSTQGTGSWEKITDNHKYTCPSGSVTVWFKPQADLGWRIIISGDTEKRRNLSYTFLPKEATIPQLQKYIDDEDLCAQ